VQEELKTLEVKKVCLQAVADGVFLTKKRRHREEDEDEEEEKEEKRVAKKLKKDITDQKKKIKNLKLTTCAEGNNIVEVALKGMLELIDKDSVYDGEEGRDMFGINEASCLGDQFNNPRYKIVVHGEESSRSELQCRCQTGMSIFFKWLLT
jgi:hypothetical protein